MTPAYAPPVDLVAPEANPDAVAFEACPTAMELPRALPMDGLDVAVTIPGPAAFLSEDIDPPVPGISQSACPTVHGIRPAERLSGTIDVKAPVPIHFIETSSGNALLAFDGVKTPAVAISRRQAVDPLRADRIGERSQERDQGESGGSLHSADIRHAGDVCNVWQPPAMAGRRTVAGLVYEVKPWRLQRRNCGGWFSRHSGGRNEGPA